LFLVVGVKNKQLQSQNDEPPPELLVVFSTTGSTLIGCSRTGSVVGT
jgi:hypothetical protein